MSTVKVPTPTVPIAEDWQWQLRASCRSMPAQVFFPPDGLRGYTLRYHEQDAQAICSRCPVIRACLFHALEHDEQFGVWGGMTTRQRQGITPPGRVRRKDQRTS